MNDRKTNWQFYKEADRRKILIRRNGLKEIMWEKILDKKKVCERINSKNERKMNLNLRELENKVDCTKNKNKKEVDEKKKNERNRLMYERETEKRGFNRKRN